VEFFFRARRERFEACSVLRIREHRRSANNAAMEEKSRD